MLSGEEGQLLLFSEEKVVLVIVSLSYYLGQSDTLRRNYGFALWTECNGID